MRRQEKEIRTRDAIDAVIFDCQVCHLAMARENQPYLVPLSYGYDGRHIYFHTAPQGHKIECLKANPRVCFQMERRVRLINDADNPCRWTFHFESVVGQGTASEIRELVEKRNGLNQITAHYGAAPVAYNEAALAALSVWRIAISSVTGKRSPSG